MSHVAVDHSTHATDRAVRRYAKVLGSLPLWRRTRHADAD